MKKINYDLLNDIMLFAKKILKLVYIFIISIIFFLAIKVIKETNLLSGIWSFLKILMPLFLGFAIAWILNPLVDRLEWKGLNRCLSSIIVFVSFVLIIAFFLLLIIPILYNQILDFTDKLPNIIDSLSKVITKVNFNKILDEFNSNLPNMFINSLKYFISCLGIIGLGLIISLYLIIDYHNIINSLKKILKKEEYMQLLTGINKEVRRCVNGTFLVATMVFVLDTLLFMIFKLPSPVLFGLLCGLTDLVPYIGPYIGGIAAVIVGFSESKFLGIVTICIVVAVQCLENMILQPIVMSKATKLHPVTIMMGLLIFGELFGIIGMILATPILAMFKVIYQYIKKYLYIKS